MKSSWFLLIWWQDSPYVPGVFSTTLLGGAALYEIA